MKQSIYNHYIEKGDFAYWYNPLYNQYFRLPRTIGNRLYTYLLKNNDLSAISTDLNQKFIDYNFIIDDNIDEVNIVRKNYNAAINRKNAFLVILPTLNCNYNCWYCIQEHVVSMMSKDTMDAVLRHIDYMIQVEKIESLQIDWFGGEPFMFFNNIIEPLSMAIIEKCEKAKIPFFNSATTNGYFLTKEITQKLVDLKFKSFQITIDGTKVHHDKVKFMKGLHSSFDRALNNINQMLSDYPSLNLVLRINYTHSNISSDIVNEVCDRLSTDIRSRITIMPKKVWQEDNDTNFENIIEPILSQFAQKGFHIDFWSPITNFLPCYVSSLYYKAINFNGHALKCTACDDLHRKHARGIIAKDGKIIWESGFVEKSSEPAFENPRCLRCKKLPVCLGGCSKHHSLQPDVCSYENNEVSYDMSITSYIDEKYRWISHE